MYGHFLGIRCGLLFVFWDFRVFLNLALKGLHDYNSLNLPLVRKAIIALVAYDDVV